MENDSFTNNEKNLTHLEQYIISLLIAGFIYGGTYFCLHYLGKLIYPYFQFSQETVSFVKEVKELFLLDRKVKYLIPIIIYLFFFGLSMQSLLVLTSKRDH